MDYSQKDKYVVRSPTQEIVFLITKQIEELNNFLIGKEPPLSDFKHF